MLLLGRPAGPPGLPPPGGRTDAGRAWPTKRASAAAAAGPPTCPIPRPRRRSDPELNKVKELLAGGPYLRAILWADPDGRPAGAAKRPTRRSPTSKARTTTTRCPPAGPRWWRPPAPVPSPFQASLAEPAQNPAIWNAGEAGVAVSLTGGDLLLGGIRPRGRRPRHAVQLQPRLPLAEPRLWPPGQRRLARQPLRRGCAKTRSPARSSTTTAAATPGASSRPSQRAGRATTRRIPPAATRWPKGSTCGCRSWLERRLAADRPAARLPPSSTPPAAWSG